MDDVVDINTAASPVRFTFDSSQAVVNATNVFRERNNLNVEINQIVSRIPSEMSLNPMVFTMFWQQFSGDEANLVRNLVILSRAFKRLAELYAKFQPLDKQVDVVNFILANPNFATLTFGDLSADVPEAHLFTTPPDDHS